MFRIIFKWNQLKLIPFCSEKFSGLCQNKMKQESPPARTEEAYRPLRGKCSLCCSVSCGEGGTPHPVPTGGYPQPVLMGEGTLLQSQWGYPISQMVVLPFGQMGYAHWPDGVLLRQPDGGIHNVYFTQY